MKILYLENCVVFCISCISPNFEFMKNPSTVFQGLIFTQKTTRYLVFFISQYLLPKTSCFVFCAKTRFCKEKKEKSNFHSNSPDFSSDWMILFLESFKNVVKTQCSRFCPKKVKLKKLELVFLLFQTPGNLFQKPGHLVS